MSLERLKSGVPGFDDLISGGLPRGRASIVIGSAGCGKSILCSQFLYSGAVDFGESGVYVNFEEPVENIVKNLESFDWDVEKLVKNKKWLFVDASPSDSELISAGKYDLDALLARIENAVKKINAKRVVLDSVSAFYSRFKDANVRALLYLICARMRSLGVSVFMTAERANNDALTSSSFVESFVADNVISLHYSHTAMGERLRSIEVVKARGCANVRRDAPFSISDKGVVVSPWLLPALEGKEFIERTSIGIPGLDVMLEGGVFRGCASLIAGPTGAGKTIACLHFLVEGLSKGEACLFVSFEETAAQLRSEALQFGWDLASFEKKGLLNLYCNYVDSADPVEHFTKIKHLIEDKNIKRIAVDAVSGMDEAHSVGRSREFSKLMVSFTKSRGVTLLLTSETASLIATETATGGLLSSLVDNIIMLKYVESGGKLGKVVVVLKSRGTNRDKNIRQLDITDKGIVIGEALSNVEGAMTGVARKIGRSTAEMLREEVIRTIGPMGVEVFRELSEKGLSEDNLGKFVDGLVSDGVMKPASAKLFRERLSSIFRGEEVVEVPVEKKESFLGFLGGKK